MSRLFDLEAATPKQAPLPAKPKRKELEQLLPSGAPQLVWRTRLDHGADPIAIAALLRDHLPRAERRRAYLELVRDLGPRLAAGVWEHAFPELPSERKVFPVGLREMAEAAIGM